MDAPDVCSPQIHTLYNETEQQDSKDVNQDTHKNKEKNNSISSRVKYTVLVAQHPYAVFLVTLVVIVICALCAFVPAFNAPDFPDFSEPVIGFEPRGTTINTRWRTRLFFSKAIQKGLLFTAPTQQQALHNFSLDLQRNTSGKGRPNNNSNNNNNTNNNSTIINNNNNSNNTNNNSTINNNNNNNTNDNNNNNKRLTRSTGNSSGLSMCKSTSIFMKDVTNFKTVFAPKRSGDNLMTASSLKAMCRLEEKILRNFSGFRRGCYTRKNVSHYGGEISLECCPSWSVGNYIATCTGRRTCQDIQDDDVDKTMKILQKCFRFFQNGTLRQNCWDPYQGNYLSSNCKAVPSECSQNNAVYNILYYLTDKSFLTGGDKLKYSLILTPHDAEKQFTVDVYKKYLKNGELTEGDVKLVATDYNRLKFIMFNELLIADIIYPAIAMLIILVILWFYTESVLLTVLLLLSVVSALIIAYFIYMVAFSLKFFPFLNVTTLIFLVGIGADDAFVFTDVWRQAKKNNPGACLTKITAETFKHASMSMFVTSFTTAAAFIANFSSQITTIKCFGLYAGIAILCKFGLMVTWFPALCVINEKWCVARPACFARSDANATNSPNSPGFLRSCYEKTIKSLARHTFDNLLPRLVIKFRYIWVVLFLSLTLCGIIVLTVKPGFQLPTSADFQMFASSHPLESYDLYFKEKFRFEVSSSRESGAFPIDIFWGIKAVDTGDFLDPKDHGEFEWDETFDVVSPASQRWLISFCQKLRKQNFVAKTPDLAQGCFLETFYNQSCTTPKPLGRSLYPCCQNSSFPFNETVLDLCASHRQLLSARKKEPSAFIYDLRGNIRGVHLRVQSNVRLSRAYHPQQKFWERVESWVNQELANAPVGMRRGWFISDVEFYNLQKSLSRGMLVSLGISIAMAFVVMLLTTLNILVSIYAILTIIGTISVTIGSLVLSGWKLNILESITMSVAVGVSVDFAMHFGVAYCLAPNKSCRKARVAFSISRMGSAITMAAVTTFIAGSMMMPSAVLSYIQMGHFLMLVMAVSWAFSTFFFQSLCSIAGPQGEWGQLSWARIKQFCCRCGQEGDVTNNETDVNGPNQGGKNNKDDECHEEPLLHTTGV